MIIYIDLDSTVFDYRHAYSKAHEKHTGDLIIPTDEELVSVGYHMNKLFGLSEVDKYDYLTQDFFRNMKPYQYSITSIEILHRLGYEIRFVTHIVTTHAYEGKVQSLMQYFNWFVFDHHLICMKDKHLLLPGIIIDDNPTVIEASMGHHVVIKYDQPWNTHVEADYSISRWGLHLTDLILNLEGVQ